MIEVAIDIGANIGAFTCLLASTGAQVHAFEPIPDTFCRMKANVKINHLLGNCHLNCLAVGKNSDLVTFRVQDNSPATNRLDVSGQTAAGGEKVSNQTVASIDLDSYCRRAEIKKIEFCKIDVEGMEPLVLQGARQLMTEKRIAAILIEICPGNLRSVGLSPADLYREFEIARYSPYVLNDNGQPGAKLSLAEIEAMSLANVVLLPDA